MDALLNTATDALRRGDALGALRCVALRDDAPALALRGIALAQLGELLRARELLQAAARAFGTRDSLAKARCLLAQAEIALATRDLVSSQRGLQAALHTLTAHGDSINALHARLLLIRRLVLLGRLAEAQRALDALDLNAAPSVHRAVAELIRAELALRSLHTRRARTALSRAQHAARRAAIPALLAEIDSVAHTLKRPAARLWLRGKVKLATLAEIERCAKSMQLLIDARQRSVGRGKHSVILQRRPVLFALMRALAEAWPSSVPRARLIASVFGVVRANESHRARLRVEVGRLRKLLEGLVGIQADEHGFGLTLRGTGKSKASVVVLSPLDDGQDAALRSLLADGAAWSSSGLALALGSSQRSVQRALATLEANGEAHSVGRGRAQRWLSRLGTTSAAYPAI